MPKVACAKTNLITVKIESCENESLQKLTLFILHPF